MSALAPSRDAEAIRGRSLWDDAWRKLRRNRAATLSACVIGAMAVLVIAGPWLARLAYDFADFSNVMSAPMLSLDEDETAAVKAILVRNGLI